MSSARLFGKLPAHGDFIARGLAAAERDALDAWLSAEMLAAREALGADFEDRFDRAPPWRFAGPDGAGVLVASVDGVGRRFPLYLALSAPLSSPARGRWRAHRDGGGGKQPNIGLLTSPSVSLRLTPPRGGGGLHDASRSAVLAGEDAAAQLEDLAYRAFAENWDADALYAEVGALAFSAEPAPPAARWWTLGGEGFAPAEMHGDHPEGLLAKVLKSEVNA